MVWSGVNSSTYLQVELKISLVILSHHIPMLPKEYFLVVPHKFAKAGWWEIVKITSNSRAYRFRRTIGDNSSIDQQNGLSFLFIGVHTWSDEPAQVPDSL